MRRVRKARKIRRFFIFLLVANIVLGYITVRRYEKEVVDIKKYSDYYTGSESEGGGHIVLESSFQVYQKQYIIKSEEEKNREKAISSNRKTTIMYTIQSGDYLGKIEEKFGQSETVIKYNNPQLRKYLIIGKKLKITPGNTIEYKVKKGDTLGKIANNFGKSVEAIILENNISDNNIFPNQTLIIDSPKIDYVRLRNEKRRRNNDGLNPFKPLSRMVVTSSYGRRFHPVLARWIGHLGVDLRAKYVPVFAFEDGKIIFSGQMNGYGNLIIIRHKNGYTSRYGHLKARYVRNGQWVKGGEKIALSGATGRVTGPHLHFEVRKNGTPLNPMKFFKK